MLRITSIVALCLFFSFPAQAKHRHHHRHYAHRVQHARVARAPALHKDCNILFPCEVAQVVAAPIRAVVSGVRQVASSVAEVVAHPAGCPARAFCGCGASVRVFGHSVRELWLAANWYRFPRAAPAPGMVAVRPHHVFVLEADLGGGVWSVYDANSGRGLTRIHARSLSGYTIVSPRNKVASWLNGPVK